MAASGQLGQDQTNLGETSSEIQDTVDESSRSLTPRIVTMKLYVNRDIWEATGEAVATDVNTFMVDSLENMLAIANKHLSHLDNGGYFAQFDKTVSRLEESDVTIRNTFIDRQDGNATKTFDKSQINSHTFTFQEAVQEMEGR